MKINGVSPRARRPLREGDRLRSRVDGKDVYATVVRVEEDGGHATILTDEPAALWGESMTLVDSPPTDPDELVEWLLA